MSYRMTPSFRVFSSPFPFVLFPSRLRACSGSPIPKRVLGAAFVYSRWRRFGFEAGCPRFWFRSRGGKQPPEYEREPKAGA